MKTKSNKKYKNAWLVGSSGGIGKSIIAILEEYAENICICDIKNANDVSFYGKNKKIKFWQVDCSNEDEFIKFGKEAAQEYGPPELMVIAAGYVSSLNLEATSNQEIDKIYVNNFKVVTATLKVFFEKCSKDNNVPKNIIVIGSNAGLEPRPGQPVYAAMKSAIHSLVQSQALSWGKFNIKINVIAPGTVAVERNINSLKIKYKDFPKDLSRPLGRIAFPEDLQGAFRFLFDKDLLMTGQILLIDGGSNLS